MSELPINSMDPLQGRYTEQTCVCWGGGIGVHAVMGSHQRWPDWCVNIVVLQTDFYNICCELDWYLPYPSPVMTWQKIQAEIAGHESTLEELKRNVRLLMPASPECRSPRGGSHLDVLQVNITSFWYCQFFLCPEMMLSIINHIIRNEQRMCLWHEKIWPPIWIVLMEFYIVHDQNIFLEVLHISWVLNN